MLWTVTNFLLFLFVYLTTGIPLHDEPKQKLSLTLIPSQWGKDSEISYHWPKGEVPYVFDDKSYDEGVKARVRIAMAALERDSCIRFKELKGEGDGSWLHFTNPGKQRQCFHEPSYQAKGEIQVVLGYDCLRQRDIMHSVLHGVGFRDEISHPQRDLFVKIMWGNIQSAYKPMFRIQPVEANAGGLVEYDPMSIMHFHDRAYSLNGQATITPLLPGLRIAPSDRLSHLDKMKLRIMFGHECNKRKVGEVLNKCKGILTQYDESELSTTKPKDDNTPNNEDMKDNPIGNNGDDPVMHPNANDDSDCDQNGNGHGNNDGDEDIKKNRADEVIVVGNNAGGNNNGDQNQNANGLQEIIVVGNEANGNDNMKESINDEIITKDNGIEKIDENPINFDNEEAKQSSEVIIVGNDKTTNNNGKDNGIDKIDENPINFDNEAKQSSEVIIVGNDKTSNNNVAEDLRGKLVHKSDVEDDHLAYN